jgi:HEAT repeat protein
MNLKFLVNTIPILMGSMIASPQGTTDQELAHLLAGEQTRRTAVTMITEARESKVPLLLSWANAPPSDVDKYELYIGLADAFGQLKTREAIPFLIENISLDRTRAVNTWLKAPHVIEERLAAVAALIRIGPDACRALIRASWGPMTPEDRRAAIFAVSSIASKVHIPEARDFLSAALAEANMDRYWAEEGIKLLSLK